MEDRGVMDNQSGVQRIANGKRSSRHVNSSRGPYLLFELVHMPHCSLPIAAIRTKCSIFSDQMTEGRTETPICCTDPNVIYLVESLLRKSLQSLLDLSSIQF